MSFNNHTLIVIGLAVAIVMAIVAINSIESFQVRPASGSAAAMAQSGSVPNTASATANH